MSADPSRSDPRPAPPSLRLPLIALLGVMTMGSGLGNPGCGTSDYSSAAPPYVQPVCDEGCDAIAGTYQVSFKGWGPLDPDCASLGMKLPEEWHISRKGDKVLMREEGRECEGTYYHTETPRQFHVWGSHDRVMADGRHFNAITYFTGVLQTMPANPQAPASFTGTYISRRISPTANADEPPKCNIEREFTATRKVP